MYKKALICTLNFQPVKIPVLDPQDKLLAANHPLLSMIKRQLVYGIAEPQINTVHLAYSSLLSQ